jgi:hypothetical protein
VVDGEVQVGDRFVGPGSYVHVPAGAAHATTTGPSGCTIFYLFRPTDS